MATAPTKLWTIDDLDDLPDGRFEIWGGELVEMPAAGNMHSSVALAIGSAVHQFVRAQRLGTASTTDGGYVQSRDPLIMLIPDVAFVSLAKLPERTPRIPEIVPDLVVEVVSPTDRATDVRDKVDIYLRAGVAIVWVALPEQRLVQVYRSDLPSTVSEVRAGEELDGGDVLPGFRLPLFEIFD